MRMCSTELMCRAVWSTKGDGDIKLPARHRVHIRRVVHNLIECHERKAERHKFNNRSQADHRRANAQAGKAILANWCVDNASRAKMLKQTVADFVGALVFSDFFAHQKNIRITLHFFRERLVERLTICDFSHRPSFAVVRLRRMSASDLSDFVDEPPADVVPLAYV